MISLTLTFNYASVDEALSTFTNTKVLNKFLAANFECEFGNMMISYKTQWMFSNCKRRRLRCGVSGYYY